MSFYTKAQELYPNDAKTRRVFLNHNFRNILTNMKRFFKYLAFLEQEKIKAMIFTGKGWS
jgi:hypothetical protein